MCHKSIYELGYKTTDRMYTLFNTMVDRLCDREFVQDGQIGDDYSIFSQLEYDPKQSLRIPAITHHIWVTTNSSPRELFSGEIAKGGRAADQIFFNNLKILKNNTLEWQHILWTNDRTLIPKSTELLEKANFSIKNIDLLLVNSELGTLIHSLEDHSHYAAVSDIVRLLALYQYGGIYLDIDYIIMDSGLPVDKMLQYFNYFGGKEVNTKGKINNAFLIASPKHPIIKESLQIIEDNLLHGGALKLQQMFDICDDLPYTEKMHLTTGHIVSTVAFCKKNNMEGNKDILFKAGMVYKCQYNLDSGQYLPSTIAYTINAIHDYFASYVNTYYGVDYGFCSFEVLSNKRAGIDPINGDYYNRDTFSYPIFDPAHLDTSRDSPASYGPAGSSATYLDEL